MKYFKIVENIFPRCVLLEKMLVNSNLQKEDLIQELGNFHRGTII